MDKLSYNKYPSKIHKKLETSICKSLNFKIFIIKVSPIPKIFNLKLIIILPFSNQIILNKYLKGLNRHFQPGKKTLTRQI